MAENGYHDERNRMRVGNKGRPKGSADKGPRKIATRSQKIRSQIAKANAAELQVAGEKYLGDALKCLGEEAKTNAQAAANFVRLVAPSAPKTYVEGAERLVGLLPEDRLPAISALLASGEIDVMSASALTASAKAECEFSFVRPLRAALGRLDEAAKSGSRAAVEAALIGLSAEVRRLQSGGVIDGEGNGD